jgi:chaperonin GroES
MISIHRAKQRGVISVLYYCTVGKGIWGGTLTISVQHKILSLAKSPDKTGASKNPESLPSEFVRGGILMKVRPLYDRLIVKRSEEEEKTKGGIIIPDTAKEKPIEGKVIAVGKGKINEDGTKIPMEVKKGDRILFAKYAGSEVKIDSEEHLIMKEDDVIAIIEQ